MFPKPGKPLDSVSSYRPISLLGSNCKPFETLIHARLYSQGTEYSIFSLTQSGFHKQHSCVHQVLRVTNLINDNKAGRRSTGIVLFDIKKASDKVSHDGLIYNSAKSEFLHYICKIINVFCRSRLYNVHNGNAISRDMPIPARLAQCSFPSTILFVRGGPSAT